MTREPLKQEDHAEMVKNLYNHLGIFFGTHVCESNFKRKCGKCRKMIGYHGQSYIYGVAGNPCDMNKDVCKKCHHRIWVRWSRLNPQLLTK